MEFLLVDGAPLVWPPCALPRGLTAEFRWGDPTCPSCLGVEFDEIGWRNSHGDSPVVIRAVASRLFVAEWRWRRLVVQVCRAFGPLGERIVEQHMGWTNEMDLRRRLRLAVAMPAAIGVVAMVGLAACAPTPRPTQRPTPRLAPSQAAPVQDRSDRPVSGASFSAGGPQAGAVGVGSGQDVDRLRGNVDAYGELLAGREWFSAAAAMLAEKEAVLAERAVHLSGAEAELAAASAALANRESVLASGLMRLERDEASLAQGLMRLTENEARFAEDRQIAETALGASAAAVAEQEARLAAEQTRLAEVAGDLAAEATVLEGRATRISQEETRLADWSDQLTAEAARLAVEADLLAEHQARLDAQAVLLAEGVAGLAEHEARLAAEETRLVGWSDQLTAEAARLAVEADLLAEDQTRLEAQAVRLAEGEAGLVNVEARLAMEETRFANWSDQLTAEAARLAVEADLLAENQTRLEAQAARLAEGEAQLADGETRLALSARRIEEMAASVAAPQAALEYSKRSQRPVSFQQAMEILSSGPLGAFEISSTTGRLGRPIERGDQVVTVAAPADRHVFVKMVDRGDPARLSAVFVPMGRRANLRVGPGTYEMLLAVGSDWYGWECDFGPDAEYLALASPMVFRGGEAPSLIEVPANSGAAVPGFRAIDRVAFD